jgi:hypothetical protein
VMETKSSLRNVVVLNKDRTTDNVQNCSLYYYIILQLYALYSSMGILCHGQRELSQWKHEGKDPVVEEALSQLFSTVNGQGVRVSDPMLKNKSKS